MTISFVPVAILVNGEYRLDGALAQFSPELYATYSSDNLASENTRQKG
jgi:hypothetical protein